MLFVAGVWAIANAASPATIAHAVTSLVIITIFGSSATALRPSARRFSSGGKEQARHRTAVFAPEIQKKSTTRVRFGWALAYAPRLP